jgi:hypothetical protein
MTACFVGHRFAMLGRNQAVVLAPDLVACDGLIHIVDSVLITPALTTLRQLTLRPELSLFTQIVTAPGNELLVTTLILIPVWAIGLTACFVVYRRAIWTSSGLPGL